jgi:hypothetical protein
MTETLTFPQELMRALLDEIRDEIELTPADGHLKICESLLMQLWGVYLNVRVNRLRDAAAHSVRPRQKEARSDAC